MSKPTNQWKKAGYTMLSSKSICPRTSTSGERDTLPIASRPITEMPFISYTYDLTSTLQANLTQPTCNRPPPSVESSRVQHVADHAFHETPTGSAPNVDRATITKSAWGFNNRFVWNHFLLSNAFFESMETEGPDGKKERSCWVLPLVYGYVDQASEPATRDTSC